MSKLKTQHMTYEPWTDGYAVGFKCTDFHGRVSYIYLNPSSEDSEDGPDVFLYQGYAGDPAIDSPMEWFATDWHVCSEDNPKREDFKAQAALSRNATAQRKGEA